MQALRLLHSTPEAWFGRPLAEVPDGDLWRWYATRRVAERIL